MDLSQDIITMIKKTLSAVIFSIALSFSSLSFAHGALEHNMQTLAKNFKAFNKAKNQQDALQALDNMKTAALDSKKVDLKTNDAKAPSSDALFDQLVAEIDKTRTLVQAGKLDQAKLEGKKIAAVKDQGHAIYNRQ
jgi:soluble cytochrome b562